jgi:hypothetical protein
MEKLILEIDDSKRENDRMQANIMEMDRSYKKVQNELMHVQ